MWPFMEARPAMTQTAATTHPTEMTQTAAIEKIMEDQGLVPVYAEANPETAIGVMRACWRAGLRLFEFTNRNDNALEVFRQLKAVADAELPGLVLGAGTIYDPETAAAFVEVGARFVVSPIGAEETGHWCRERDIAFVPGTTTPSEIWRAQSLGAGIVKLYPGAVLGVGYLKQILGPLRGSRILVTGGVRGEPASVREWLGAGAVAIGLGSDVLPNGSVDSGRLDALAEKCAELLTVAREVKGATS